MYRVLTSPNDSKASAIAFAPENNGRAQDCIVWKKDHGQFHFRLLIKDKFGFAERPEKATVGLGYKMTMKRTSDFVALARYVFTVDGKIATKDICF